ncbi:MAG TPA: hypothetical protein VJY62_19855 [Bacteroidia bacterium]|nr:hypothetical protein [Bacteroidia bacterium]
MNKGFIILAIILQTKILFGQISTQQDTNRKWTVGIILISEPSYFYSDNFSGKFSPDYFNGITIKRHLNFLSIRFGIEYSKTTVKVTEPDCCDILYSDGYHKEWMFRLGIEKGIRIKDFFKPFLAIDLTGIKIYSDRTLSGGFAGIRQKVISHTTGFGLTPAIGIEFQLLKVLSVSLETRLRAIHYDTTEEIDNLYDSAGSYERTNDQFQTAFNRIGLVSVNINF